MNLKWDEDGALFVGRIFVGRIDREVPENWREQINALDHLAPDHLARRFHEIEMAQYANREANPWAVWMQTAYEGAGDDLGHFETENDAKQALEAAVRKEFEAA